MSVKHYTTAQFIATFGSEYNETDTGMLTVSYKADGVRIVIPLPENMQSVGHIVCEHLTTPFGDVLVAFDIMPANIFGSRQASLAHAVHTICSKEIQERATPVVMKPRYTINEWHDARRDAFPYTEDGWIICDRNNRPAKWKPRLTYVFQVLLHKPTPSTNEFELRATSSDDVSTRRTDDVKQYITLTPDEQKVIADAYEQSPIWNERIIEVYRERDSWRFIRPRPDKSKANRWQLVLDLLHDEDERARLQPTVTTVPEPTTTFCFKTVCCYHRHVKKHLYHVAGSGRTVLDVCAGKCKDARAWRASGLRHVVAVERDTNAVEYANKFIDELKQDDAPQHAMPPVDVLQMDMCVERLCKRLPAGFRFERAFCHFAIHYLFDGDTDTLCKSFIANMTHSLVAGAQFIVTFMDGECYNAEEGFCVGTGEDTFDVRAADEPLRGTYVDVRVPTIGTFHRERVVNTALLTKALQPHGFQFERKWSLGSFRHLVHTEGVPIMLGTLERALVNRFSCALFTYRKDSLGADYLSPFAGKCPIVLRLVSSYLDGTSVVRFGSTTTALHLAHTCNVAVFIVDVSPSTVMVNGRAFVILVTKTDASIPNVCIVDVFRHIMKANVPVSAMCANSQNASIGQKT